MTYKKGTKAREVNLKTKGVTKFNPRHILAGKILHEQFFIYESYMYIVTARTVRFEMLPLDIKL